MQKEEFKEWLNLCVSAGRYLELPFKITHEDTLKIEYWLYTKSDGAARTKIKKLLKENYEAFLS